MPIPAGYHEPLLTPRAAREVEAVWTYVAPTHGTEVVLPDGRCDVIVHFNIHTNAAPVAILTGPATLPYTLTVAHGDTWVGLRLQPTLGAAIWGNALSHQTNQVLIGDAALAFMPALARVYDSARDVVALQSVLLGLPFLQNSPPPPPMLRPTLDAIHTSGGRLSVAQLAQRVGLSPRHLGRIFQGSVGLPPKTYSRLVRCHRAVSLLKSAHMTLPDIALEAGFADQSHMSREIRQFAGFPPTALPETLSQPGFFG